jgi:Iap family predicted aminopeptidase
MDEYSRRPRDYVEITRRNIKWQQQHFRDRLKRERSQTQQEQHLAMM